MKNKAGGIADYGSKASDFQKRQIMPNLIKYVKSMLNRKEGEERPVQENSNDNPLIYKTFEVQEAFTAASERFRKEWQQAECTDEDFQRYKKLKEIGLTESASMKEVQKKVTSIKRKKCLKSLSANGSCLCVSFDEFRELLLKFGLVCGKISAYLGYIPDEKLEEIVEACKLLEFIKERNAYSNKKNDDSFFEIITSVFNPSPCYRPILPDEIIKRQEISSFPFYLGNYNEHLMNTERLCNTDLLIAAPDGEIKSLFPVERRCQNAFVFQLCPYGVVIFSMW